ncbi:hypothetical protein ASC77_06905 [Nocardioides sp. Root1257]|uniref:ABC transporter permease subunit n=1 Tax=unclassified Nocardioides TaxID=2615069 RepID=UPI0006F790A4|nr:MULTISPECIES: ABC transporter permease subunit [unclassified Nocardioides]KQW48480.1 hypothetical protein ASC77_06905 [Nocardioides sp. Root1257]KRC47656.1 hypothetical protein ASE24_06910 [Nocardioides sp. Root224]
MTVLAAPPTLVHPVPWTRLAWVAWRRYRSVLVGTLLLLAALSVYLLVTGNQLRSAYADVDQCQPPVSSSACQIQWMGFVDKYGNTGFLGPFLLLLPGVIGVFAGAPLFGRELETGTFRYAWTQGIGRMRLAIALIVPGAVGVVALMVGIGALETWRAQPLADAGIARRLEGSLFPTAGPAVAGWALLAFTGGVLAGLLWRRTVPALGSVFALWFGLAFAASRFRLHYLTPLTTTKGEPDPHDVVTGQWWTSGGVRVSDSDINSQLAALGVQMDGDGFHAQAGPGSDAPPDPIEWLSQHGYTQVISYQPDHRYWTFQWIELGWLLALSAALLAITFWLLRRMSA